MIHYSAIVLQPILMGEKILPFPSQPLFNEFDLHVLKIRRNQPQQLLVVLRVLHNCNIVADDVPQIMIITGLEKINSSTIFCKLDLHLPTGHLSQAIANSFTVDYVRSPAGWYISRTFVL